MRIFKHLLGVAEELFTTGNLYKHERAEPEITRESIQHTRTISGRDWNCNDYPVIEITANNYAEAFDVVEKRYGKFTVAGDVSKALVHVGRNKWELRMEEWNVENLPNDAHEAPGRGSCLKTFVLFCLIVALGLYAGWRQLPAPAPAQAAGPLLPATHTVTVYSTPTPNAEMTLLFARATDTVIAIAKTEAYVRSQRETQAAIDFANLVAMTSQAQQAQAVATQQAFELQRQLTAQATQTQGMAVIFATQTQGAAVVAASTQLYWAQVTQTGLAATQQVEKSKLQASKVRVWGWTVAAMTVIILFLAWMGGKVWRSWKMSQAEYLQATALPPDQNGRLPVVNTNALGRHNKLVNPNLAHRAVIDPEHDDLTTEQALANTQLHTGLEATRAIAQSPLLRRALGRQPVSTETPMPQANVEITKPMMPLLGNRSTVPASWALVENWDGKGPIPHGVDAAGQMECVDLSKHYHFGVFGGTGEGKSRYWLRPFIAALLANGQRVVIIGKTGDFWPFAHHPNCKLIAVRRVTDPAEAERYAGYLKRIVGEMDVRDEYLTSHHTSTWERADRENTFVVLDEVGNALSKMPSKIREDAYRWIDALAREGRKAGFNLITASQRAVGFKSIVEQMRRVVFHVEDADTSRIALGFPGAEELPTSSGQFYAKIGKMSWCRSFNPTDEQLATFLQARSVPQLEPIDWIEGDVREVEDKHLEKPAQPESKPVDDTDARILALYEAMLTKDKVSIAAIQRAIYGRQIPADFYHVQELIAAYQAKQRSTTTTDNGPDLDPLAA